MGLGVIWAHSYSGSRPTSTCPVTALALGAHQDSLPSCVQQLRPAGSSTPIYVAKHALATEHRFSTNRVPGRRARKAGVVRPRVSPRSSSSANTTLRTQVLSRACIYLATGRAALTRHSVRRGWADTKRHPLRTTAVPTAYHPLREACGDRRARAATFGCLSRGSTPGNLQIRSASCLERSYSRARTGRRRWSAPAESIRCFVFRYPQRPWTVEGKATYLQSTTTSTWS